ncbi:MAG: glycosyltransferase [Lachnospiraceae bacterium]|nr:glycosyltransferase [Lachnospiraceae bacterium]
MAAEKQLQEIKRLEWLVRNRVIGNMVKQDGKVSVIIPLYNGEKHIEATVNSILHSDYRNLEVLIINDGSTDNSLMICERLRRADNRITIYDKENEGTVSARNYGVSRAEGAYLCFCDQDDIVDEKCYSKQAGRMELDQSDICMCSVGRSIDGKRSAFELSDDACYEGDEILEQLLYPLLFNDFDPPVKMGAKNRYPHIWSCMFRMDFWKKCRLKFRAYVNFEDDLLVKTQALASARRVSTIAHIGYYWRVNLSSETYAHKYIAHLAEKQQKCYEDMYRSIAGRVGDGQTLELFKSAVYCRQYLEAIHNLASPEKKKTRKTIQQYYEKNIYSRSFEKCITAAKMVKKGKVKPQIILGLLAGKHTMLSYYAEVILDYVLLITLHSQTLTKIERKLKGIRMG